MTLEGVLVHSQQHRGELGCRYGTRVYVSCLFGGSTLVDVRCRCGEIELVNSAAVRVVGPSGGCSLSYRCIILLYRVCHGMYEI